MILVEFDISVQLSFIYIAYLYRYLNVLLTVSLKVQIVSGTGFSH